MPLLQDGARFSDYIFSLILPTSSGNISTSYRLLICSAMSCCLIPQAYRVRIFSSILSALRSYSPMIFWLEIAFPISGPLDIDLPQLGLDRFVRIAVAVIWKIVFLACPLAAFPPQFLVHLHFHHLLDDIPEHLLHGGHNVCRAGEVLALHILLQ